MVYASVNEYQQAVAEMEADLGEPVTGWVEFRDDGSIEFLIADTTEPYGC